MNSWYNVLTPTHEYNIFLGKGQTELKTDSCRINFHTNIFALHGYYSDDYDIWSHVGMDTCKHFM